MDCQWHNPHLRCVGPAYQQHGRERSPYDFLLRSHRPTSLHRQRFGRGHGKQIQRPWSTSRRDCLRHSRRRFNVGWHSARWTEYGHPVYAARCRGRSDQRHPHSAHLQRDRHASQYYGWPGEYDQLFLQRVQRGDREQLCAQERLHRYRYLVMGPPWAEYAEYQGRSGRKSRSDQELRRVRASYWHQW
ncbi:hypothetical protein D3C85_1312370 [compost metagenome]